MEGLKTVSIIESGAEQVSIDEFRDILLNGGSNRFYKAETGPAGVVSAIVTTNPGNLNDTCRNYLDTYLAKQPFSWEPEYIFLINEPCIIAVSSGVVFLSGGEIVSETLFPTGNATIASCVGGGLSAENIASELRKAPELNERVWAPLFSFGSSVYGHALAESMVQDAALFRAGLSSLVSYAATAWPAGAQELLMSRAHSPIAKFPCLLVKVPRVVFASKLYRHLPLGFEFQSFIGATKNRVLSGSTISEASPTKIYVSRIGMNTRRLTNEQALIDKLSEMGFHILSGELLPFEEQVQAFQNARLIVGPYGSGLTNAAFAAPDAILCELRSLNNRDHSPNWDDFYFALAATMGFSYGVHVSENPPNASHWRCNIREVVDFVHHAASHDPEINLSVSTASLSNRFEQSIVTMTASDHTTDSATGFWEIEDHRGDDQYSVLARLHQHLKPKSYLEVGFNDGLTLALSSCSSIVIDPKLDDTTEILGQKPCCMLFKMHSDTFFSQFDLKAVLGRAIDLAVLHGPHLFEYVLRDFRNVELSAKQNSVIVIYDCIPTDAHVGRRSADDQRFAKISRHPHWWAGDVWKAILALRKFRPDLHIHTFDASPTGLTLITNLDPLSRILEKNYFDMIAEFRDVDLGQYGIQRYLEELNPRDTKALRTLESIGELFWL